MNPLLKNYFPVADIIAGTFGPGCEVAVHDLEQPDRSVVYVAGSVTGRKAGQSFDHLVKNVLHVRSEWQNDPLVVGADPRRGAPGDRHDLHQLRPERASGDESGA